MHRLRAIYAFVALLAPASAADAASLSEMEQQMAAIATRYLQVWSSNDAGAVANVPYVYGQTILFYGRRYTQAQLMAEKGRAIQRWPVRDYRHRPGSMRAICKVRALRCVARSVIDYRVENPKSGATRRGSARFDLGVSFAGPRPLILYENGGRGDR